MSSKIYFENEESDTETDNGSTENDNNKPIGQVTRDNDSDVDDADVSDEEKDEEEEEEEEDPDVNIPQDVDDATIESDIISEDEDELGEDEDEPEENIDAEDNEIEVEQPVKGKKSKKTSKKQLMLLEEEDYDDENDGQNENYLEKFDADLVKSYIEEFHPECVNHNYDEIAKLSYVVKNSDGIIVDPLHKTIPYLTKYERARVLGQRSKQIETGGKPFVKVPENIIDSYIIAELELKEKKIPFIIKRPLPGGGCEYWNLKDLEIIAY